MHDRRDQPRDRMNRWALVAGLVAVVTLGVVAAMLLTASDRRRRAGDEPQAVVAPTPAASPTVGLAPQEWVADVCGAIASWRDDVAALPGRVAAAAQQESTPQGAQRRFVEVLEAAERRNDAFLQELRATGEPAVPGGAEAAREVRGVFSDGLGALSRAAAQARALDPQEPGRFATGAATVAGTLLQAAQALAGRLERLDAVFDSQELRAAYTSSPACAALSARRPLRLP